MLGDKIEWELYGSEQYMYFGEVLFAVAIDNNIRYQTKPNYIHRKVAGNNILIPVAENVADFNGFIELNPAASFIWDYLKTPAKADEIINSLAVEFDIDKSTAEADTIEFMSSLLEHKMIVEVL